MSAYSKLPSLPIDDVLAGLKAQLRSCNSAVLVAPPGAGKTTRVPIALLDEPWLLGKQIIVLEPRRIAARSAANYMAKLLGEKIGETIGYRVRLDSKQSEKTKIIVVTEGVFTNMILADPELSSVGAVLFDEYHERSLDADLGLALALDSQSGFRPNLRIVPMSATLDGARVANLFQDAKIIKSEGRAFPIEIKYIEQAPNEKTVDAMAKAITNLAKIQDGSFLCFLPGQGEIIRCLDRLKGKLASDVDITPLYGSLPSAEQDLAIKSPIAGRRKIVLATSIAETSITIDGVHVVIDSGLARVPRYEPNLGLTRLETIKASKASITQRAGRAGRTQEGVVYRLWHEGQTAALPDFERPEILESDLSGLVLDLVQWGVNDPSQLKWIDVPPLIGWNEAKSLLISLGALDDAGRITPQGKQIQTMPLSPRLALMVLKASSKGQALDAAKLALLLMERGVGGNAADLGQRLERLNKEQSARAKKLKNLAVNIVEKVESNSNKQIKDTLSVGAILSLAFPDRIAKRVGNNQRGEVIFQLANGRKAVIDGLDKLANSEFLCVTNLQGSAASSRLISGGVISEDEIFTLHSDEIAKTRKIKFHLESKQFKAVETVSLVKLTLSSSPAKLLAEDRLAFGLVQAIEEHGLRLINLRNEDDSEASRLRARIGFMHGQRPNEYPDVSDENLISELENWLLPFIENFQTLSQITDRKVCDALGHFVGFERENEFTKLAPTSLKVPSGSSIKLRYEEDKVVLPVRVQELYGMSSHPNILNGTYPLTLELLSPAQRPIQMTKDIVGFWQGSWHDVKKEMKGRYPRHLWPDDPANAQATTRVKKKS